MDPKRRWLFGGLGLFAAIALVLFFSWRGKQLSPEKWSAMAPPLIKALIETKTAGTEPLGAVESVARFYSRRKFAPAWVEPSAFKKEVVPFGERLLVVGQEGMQPADYHAARIHDLTKKLSRARRTTKNLAELVELDVLLTDAYLLLATHFTVGKANPDLVDTDGGKKGRYRQLTSALSSALASNTVLASLDRRQRPEPAFQLLKKALEEHHELARKGGWPMIPQGPDLKVGSEAERVGILKRRLIVSGELEEKASSADNRFDDALGAALVRFQQSHGLKPDGVVNETTLAELNVPVDARIVQLQVNLERWRWIPRVMEDRYLLVNTTNYKVTLYEGGKPTLTLRSIIGDLDSETPIFSDEMTYLVVNPAWNIPRTIATKEMLPKIQKDLRYLEKNQIEVQRIIGGEKEKVDPRSVQWASLSEDNFNVLLRQAPGPKNPLGAMKFVFPNAHQVYLHGTLNPGLFKKEVRAFSHGCIRIERPLALAEALLKDSKEWNREKLLSAIRHEQDLTIRLPTPIPVHIRYWTAWVADNGELQFRPDVYSWDRPLQESLNQRVATTRAGELGP